MRFAETVFFAPILTMILTGGTMASAESSDPEWGSIKLGAWRIAGRHVSFSAGLPADAPMDDLKIIATCGKKTIELVDEASLFTRISRRFEGMILTGGHRISLEARIPDADCVGGIALTASYKGRTVRGGAIHFLPSMGFSTVRDTAGKPTAVRYKSRAEVGLLDAIPSIDDTLSLRGVPDGELRITDNVESYPSLREGRLVLLHSQEMNGVLVSTIEEYVIR